MSELREIRLSRVIPASPETVFTAWTTPEQFTHWWGGEGFSAPLSTIEMDARPGGFWKATMVADEDGMEIPFHGIYHDVVPGERLVFTLIDDNDDDIEAKIQAGTAEESVTITFTDRDGKTELEFLQRGYLPEEELPRAAEGWSSFFDGLAKYLGER